MPPKKRRKHEFSKNEWRARRGRGKQRERKQGKSQEGRGENEGYKMVVRENALLEKYYKGQGFIPPEEWDQFISIMKEDLPATFRITGSRSLAEHVLKCLQKKFFSQLSQLEVEGEVVPPPRPIPWYPHNLAWHVSLTRKFIRKSPLVSKFHAFLVHENEQGNISRQEAVSMIPPLLLDVKPEHKVLDMCAAPGSKTAQLIEFLHADDTDNSAMPSGVVVANDADNKRCYMLVHQAKRLNSPCFMVTNHDASVFPMLYYHDETDARHPLYYDRVLCDVPCSGDGTLRKNPTIWKSWTPGLGGGLHKLQLRILNRGLELLAPGGRLVYSTCSLNPVEDEAVVAAALSICKGTVELVDFSDRLEGLKRLNGLTSWKVMSKSGEWIDDSSDTPADMNNPPAKTMFPPKQEDLDSINLQRCCRILPHHQNTGGFFIAVFKKLDWLPWQRKQKSKEQVASSQQQQPLPTETELSTAKSADSSTSPPHVTQPTPLDDTGAVGGGDTMDETSVGLEQDTATAKGDDTAEGEQMEGSEKVASEVQGEGQGDRPPESVLGRPDFRRRRKAYKEDPYVFLKKESDVFLATKSYYGLSDSFPSDQLLTRTYTGKKRNIYFCSQLVKELTIRNEFAIKIINIGVKVMSRCEHKQTSCSFRLTQEGIDSIVQFITAHKVQVTQEDLSLILHETNPLTTSLSEVAQQAIGSLGPGVGPAVFTYTPADDTATGVVADNSNSFTITCPIHLSGWVAAKSVRLYLDKNYRYHFLAMLGHDPPTNQSLETVSAKKKTAAERRSSEELEGDGMSPEPSLLENHGELEAVGGKLDSTTKEEMVGSDNNELEANQKTGEGGEKIVSGDEEKEGKAKDLQTEN